MHAALTSASTTDIWAHDQSSDVFNGTCWLAELVQARELVVKLRSPQLTKRQPAAHKAHPQLTKLSKSSFSRGGAPELARALRSSAAPRARASHKADAQLPELSKSSFSRGGAPELASTWRSAGARTELVQARELVVELRRSQSGRAAPGAQQELNSGAEELLSSRELCSSSSME
ncbi:hypothetical protein OH77DRAFT_1520834 [Trametes cingulata]|nr:hypothetical protein OH77DRAFT_1520834 [Trametes cingulata]